MSTPQPHIVAGALRTLQGCRFGCILICFVTACLMVLPYTPWPIRLGVMVPLIAFTILIPLLISRTAWYRRAKTISREAWQEFPSRIVHLQKLATEDTEATETL